MRQPKLNLSANDNAPPRPRRESPVLKPVRFLRPERKTPPAPATNILAKHKRKITLTWGIPLLGAVMAAYAILQGAALSSLVWPAMIIGSLLLWTLSRVEPQSRLQNVSSLMLIGATTVAMAGTLAYNGFTLVGVELALLVSVFSLLLGWAMSSRPVVMLSTISAIVYLMSLFPELGLLTGLTDEYSQIGIGLIPCLLLGQALLALRLKSHLITVLTIFAVLIWVLAVAKDLPLHALAGLCFAVASAHYCLGRACEAAKIFGARLHTVFALIIGLASALYIQSLWMQFDSDQAQPIWSASTFWWGAVTLAMTVILITSLIRFKSSQISLPGIFIITLGVLVLPLATAKPELIESAFFQIPGLDAYPGLGLVIGAVIIASCLFWIASGLKHGRLLYVLIGTIGVGVEAIILYQPDYFNMDFGVIFIMSLICALCIGGLIAGSTSDQTAASNQTESTPNYA